MKATVYTVSGMHCTHCIEKVSSNIGKITGVTDVNVDLDSGAVTVTSEGSLDDAAVAAAVGEAGYTLVVA
ncbi:heavy metal transport/detoxification protein [Rhizocola hellebori]|uniref:Heavy metal transport/detoxification protein n=1 Tax=Rhizocola hellebori TaxID=1392758 RepID=A0A8J3VEN6_9ACTN|nr:heavy-metal-associated domain-containing protein [Rhizocola hellebori]GIH03491.1 heavy metal transport/detoxification protein [Rhizocola hellebori]